MLFCISPLYYIRTTYLMNEISYLCVGFHLFPMVGLKIAKKWAHSLAAFRKETGKIVTGRPLRPGCKIESVFGYWYLGSTCMGCEKGFFQKKNRGRGGDQQ